MSLNCQDNKCKRSSQSTIIIHFAVAAHGYSNVVGERFWRDYSKLNKFKLSGLKRVHDGAAAGMLVVVVLLPLSLPMYDSEFDHGGCGGGCGGPAARRHRRWRRWMRWKTMMVT